MSLTNNQIDKLSFIRNYQPSAIRSSILMAFLQASSFLGSFILMGMSIYIYASAGRNEVRTSDKLDHSISHMKHELLLRNENTTEQAYLLLIIALLLLLIWKLTTMVRRRNAYILMVDELLEDEIK